MLVAHHIIDILRGKLKHGHRVDLPGITKDMMRSTAEAIDSAQKFDFGQLLLEPDDLKRPGHWNIPRLTDDERGMWVEGFIPLPHPLCWYEWTLGHSRSGILVAEQDGGWRWHCQRIDWTNQGVLYEGISATIDRRKFTRGSVSVSIGGNIELYRAWKNYQGTANMEAVLRNNIYTSPSLVLYLTLMLNSKTTETVAAPIPSEKLNKKRMSKGYAPLAEHRIVTIVPDRFRVPRDPDAPKSTHRSPRLHWRRSHLRHYDHHVLSAKWAPEHDWNGKKGWWVSVIPRFLVGRADLGEVSHEYRIQQNAPAPLSDTLQLERNSV